LSGTYVKSMANDGVMSLLGWIGLSVCGFFIGLAFRWHVSHSAIIERTICDKLRSLLSTIY
jgi:hypothetical protein